jgi:tellurite resistance protein TerC
MFALLGLRHLYFLVGGLLGQLAHLAVGLSAILAFIGVKIIATALPESGVSRFGPVPVPRIGTVQSLAVIAGVILTVTVSSLLAGRRRKQPGGTAPPASAAPLGDLHRPGLP